MIEKLSRLQELTKDPEALDLINDLTRDFNEIFSYIDNIKRNRDSLHLKLFGDEEIEEIIGIPDVEMD